MLMLAVYKQTREMQSIQNAAAWHDQHKQNRSYNTSSPGAELNKVKQHLLSMPVTLKQTPLKTWNVQKLQLNKDWKYLIIKKFRRDL